MAKTSYSFTFDKDYSRPPNYNTMNLTKYTRVILAFILTLTISEVNAQQPAQDMMVRIAEIEIHSEYLNEYKDILKTEAAADILRGIFFNSRSFN